MAHFGLLPIPNSPIIKSTNPKDYIKPSFYPIPYQVVHIAESFQVKSTHSWDINVSKHNIVLKIQWDLDNLKTDNTTNIERFPKAVVDCISSYDLAKPTWNSSFNNNKLSLKIDWKITSSDVQPHVYNQNNSTCLSFSEPNSLNSTPKTPENTFPQRYQQDSGYSSFQTPKNYTNGENTNRSSYVNNANNYRVRSPYYQRISPSKLFDSPRKPLSRQDVYRPESTTSTNKGNQNKNEGFKANSNEMNNRTNYSSSHATSHASKSDNDLHYSHNKPFAPSTKAHDDVEKPPQSLDNTELSMTVHESVDTTRSAQQLSHNNSSSNIGPQVIVSENSSQNVTSNPAEQSLPSSSNIPKPPVTATSHPTSVPDKSIKKRKKSNSNRNPHDDSNLPDKSVSPASDSETKIISSPPKFFISNRSTKDLFVTEFDNDKHYFDPHDEEFLDNPETLKKSKDGFVDLDVEVESMELIGKCRICNT